MHRAFILLALFAASCGSTAQAPLILYAEADGIGFIRSDTVVFVGQGSVAMRAGGFWKETGTDVWPPQAMAAGKLLVVNRELDYRETFDLGEPIPAWAIEVFRGANQTEKLADAARLGITFQPET